MTVTINGETRELEPGTTVAGFLAAKGFKPQMVVVEYNAQILPRDRYDSTVVEPGATLEIVQMMAGG